MGVDQPVGGSSHFGSVLINHGDGNKSPKDFGLGWIGPLPNGLNG